MKRKTSVWFLKYLAKYKGIEMEKQKGQWMYFRVNEGDWVWCGRTTDEAYENIIKLPDYTEAPHD